MPQYVYECPQCEQPITLQRPIAQRHEIVLCPDCGGHMIICPAAPAVFPQGLRP